MKTRIAAVFILIYEILAARASSAVISTSSRFESFFSIELLLPISILLLIITCLVIIKISKVAWWSCLLFSIVNLGIICWSIIDYLSIYCDGPCQIRQSPEVGAAAILIIAAVILAGSLVLLLSDIKNVRRPNLSITAKTNVKSFLLLMIFSIIIYAIVFFLGVLSVGQVFSSRYHAYCIMREDIQTAVTAYMDDSSNSSQLPIINESATFTLTHPNGSYYIINMSELLASNGGLLREVPDGCIALTGPDNDNCDGGINGCDNTFHYIWGIDDQGNVASKPVNVVNSSELDCNACDYCQCDTCDGYQDIWP